MALAAVVALLTKGLFENWPLKVKRPRGTTPPSWLYRMRHTSPPILKLCLPRVHEKLSLNWMMVSQLMNGVSLASPGPERPLKLMFGTPQYSGKSRDTPGILSAATTFSEPDEIVVFCQ